MVRTADAITGSRSVPAVPRPPGPSRSLLADVRWYLLQRPAIPTRIDTDSRDSREDYEHRIRQRIDVSVKDYAVLNIHRIGIDAPVGFVFHEVMAGRAVPTCWPDHLAHAEFVDGRANEVLIRLFRLPTRPLFRMHASRIQLEPRPGDVDSARFAIYECRGGYPVGMFAIYVRTPIVMLEETEASQFFLAVGFNFFGLRALSGRSALRRAWEAVHDRATSNILNRFKRQCEWRFTRRNGIRASPAPRAARLR